MPSRKTRSSSFRSKSQSKSKRRTKSNADVDDRSQIILCIFAHGNDMCDTQIPYSKQQNNTLLLTLADKNNIALMGSPTSDKTEYTESILKMLTERLHNESAPVHDVVKELEHKLTRNNRYLNWNTAKLSQSNKLTRPMTRKTHATISLLKSSLNSCKKRLIARPRVVEIDRYYRTLDMGTYAGIWAVDIRNPVSKTQSDSAAIEANLNGDSETTLSSILSVCYDKYKFNYVTIFDFACRSPMDDSETCSKEGCCSCKTCRESTVELERGKQLLRKYKRLGL